MKEAGQNFMQGKQNKEIRETERKLEAARGGEEDTTWGVSAMGHMVSLG
jgi:hypothetical protein